MLLRPGRNKKLISWSCRLYSAESNQFYELPIPLRPLFDRKRNKGISPAKIPVPSGTIWWQCHLDPSHKWKKRLPSNRHQNAIIRCPICEEERNKLPILLSFPNLLREFHPTRNSMTALSLEMTLYYEAMWRCRKDHSHIWKCTVSKRVLRETGCPYCSRNKVSKIDTIAISFPNLAKEWHPTKNDCNPETIGNSMRVVWWKCKAGHEWRSMIKTRTKNSNCPFCIGKRLDPETNSLNAQDPELVTSFWDEARNTRSAENTRYASLAHYYWKCGHGHRWRERIASVAKRRTCKHCDNSFARVHPELVDALDVVKNGTTPQQMGSWQYARVWWKCLDNPGHPSYLKSVAIRRKQKISCRSCRLERATLVAKYPQVAATWHPTKNGDLRPNEIIPHFVDQTKHWWLVNGSEFHLTSSARIQRKRWPSSLQQKKPTCARYWHPVKNGDITPAMVTTSTRKMVWWRCLEDPSHEWMQSVVVMANKKPQNLCMICRRIKYSLVNVRPELAEEFHPTRNGSLDVRTLSMYSAKVVWWKCTNNDTHEWMGSIIRRSRMRERTCPLCSLIENCTFYSDGS